MSVTRSELLARLKLHEDSFVERKLEGADLKPSVVAFANSLPHGRDAVLFLGVRDNGEIAGVSNADSIQKKLQTLCRETCYPPIAFTTELIEVDSKTIIAIIIPPSASRPHFAGPAYVREGNKSVTASDRLFDELVASRSGIIAELLRYRGTTVTVASAKGRLGHPEFEQMRAGTSLTRAIQRYECRIVDVNPFFARFNRGGSLFSEPLANLVVSYDDEAHRPLIVVRLDQP